MPPPTTTPAFGFKQAREAYEPAIEQILQNNFPQLKGVYKNIVPSISKDFPYIIITLESRHRRRSEETSTPTDEAWEVKYKVIFLSTNLRIVDDVQTKIDFIDLIEQTFANERQQGKMLGTTIVTDFWTDAVTYGDFAFHDALQQQTVILTGGEFELFVVVNYTRQ